FCLATNQIAQTGLSSLPPVIYYSEQLFRGRLSRDANRDPVSMRWLNRVKYIHFAIQFMTDMANKGDDDPALP
ncbi:hypothetical protein, partial [Aeromonas caviae]|uniref:hypothetical protein n=1 Tax=Aeromonas caviae TaxID=648 RepID=UPI0030153BE4